MYICLYVELLLPHQLKLCSGGSEQRIQKSCRDGSYDGKSVIEDLRRFNSLLSKKELLQDNVSSTSGTNPANLHVPRTAGGRTSAKDKFDSLILDANARNSLLAFQEQYNRRIVSKESSLFL